MATDLLTADQVRQLLDVDKSTVYRMAGDGRLPAVKIGRQWRFPAAQVRQLLETGIPLAPTNGSSPTETAAAASTPVPLPREVARTVVELVAESLGVMMVVTDMQGRPVTPVANPCPWFVDHANEDGVVAECIDEWRDLAHDPEFEPRFHLGEHHFLCARTFVRSGTELIGMVLAGGIDPGGAEVPGDRGLHRLDDTQQELVLRMLPRVAAALSRLAGHDAGHHNSHGYAALAARADRRSPR